jgi:hypothetical protein
MALITNTAGDAGMSTVPNQTFGQILFTTPNTANAIFIAYITVQPGIYNSNNQPTIEQRPIKYILGPNTTIRWNNADQNFNLNVQWSWAQMEIQ